MTAADRLRLVVSVTLAARAVRCPPSPSSSPERTDKNNTKILGAHTHPHSGVIYNANYVAHDTRPYTRVPTYTVPFVADLSLRYMFIITEYARADGVTTNRSTFQIGSGS